MRKTVSLLLTLLMLLTLLTSCGSTAPAASQTTDEPATETQSPSEGEAAADEENYDTGDASRDDPRNQDGIGEREILVVSFGTSYNDSRRLTIGAIEQAIADAFPDWSVRRAFTSQIIIDHVRSRDGVTIDNVEQALQRAADNGVKTLIVQPTHLMDGYEYHDLVAEVEQHAASFERVLIGAPLLSSDEDKAAAVETVAADTAGYKDGKTAVVLMGHGTGADSNAVYATMQQLFTDRGYDHIFVGTVEASPSVEDVLALVRQGDYSRVVLQPLMIVAGDHANNDMAGDEEDSWNSIFTAAGYETLCVLHGLGELSEIQARFVSHVQDQMTLLEQGSTAEPAQDAAAGETGAVYAAELAEGRYQIEVDSSSSMFNVVSCTLTVKDGAMTAEMTMGGTGYLYVYPGTAEAAAAADAGDYIPYQEQSDGTHTFTIPVPALNVGVDCAAFSRKKETWYDRTLTFRSETLSPVESGDSAAGELQDGVYQVEVTLTGGTGRAGIESPAQLTVQEGACTARIVWSSPNYDYMVVNGTKYLPVNTEGNSVFELPVTAFDAPVEVLADTTAMSTPHEIAYTLLFASSTIQAAP